MEANAHLKKDDTYYFCNLFGALRWKNNEREIKEVPKSVFNFCLHGKIQKEIIKHADEDLCFTRITDQNQKQKFVVKTQ